ncbi:hypothetical protein EDB80DRAFT_770895 [Ilyonectria destructans]|nr:hypothetical protein EDB80DRAFT_770895 [Ilyonectria destructans]
MHIDRPFPGSQYNLEACTRKYCYASRSLAHRQRQGTVIILIYPESIRNANGANQGEAQLPSSRSVVATVGSISNPVPTPNSESSKLRIDSMTPEGQLTFTSVFGEDQVPDLESGQFYILKAPLLTPKLTAVQTQPNTHLILSEHMGISYRTYFPRASPSWEYLHPRLETTKDLTRRDPGSSRCLTIGANSLLVFVNVLVELGDELRPYLNGRVVFLLQPPEHLNDIVAPDVKHAP